MVVAFIAILLGVGIMVAAGLSYRMDRDRALDHLLGLTAVGAEPDAAPQSVRPLTGWVVGLAGRIVDRMDPKRSLTESLERAKIPLGPGEFVIVQAGGALGVAALLLLATHSKLLAAVGGVLTAVFCTQLVRHRVSKRRRAFERQLPDALSLIASSLSAGHTFLRAIQVMCEESSPPLSDEFARVVAETRLGDAVVDALDHMARRLQIRDMDMVVQAIRIQQTVGGRLAELLHTLADFMRARDEVRREVKVLTAEGRMSAYVLAGLVPFLFGVINVLNPGYTAPLYHGLGLGILGFCAGSVVVGMILILRMVKIDI